MDLDKIELTKSIQEARHYAKMEGRVFVVSKPQRSYNSYEVISIADHCTFDKETRPDIMFVIFPESVVNTRTN